MVEHLWSIVLLNTLQHVINKCVCKLHRVAYNSYLMVFGSAQKGCKHWILNRFLLVNSEMWIRTVIKLSHDLGVCQKTVGNSAREFYRGWWETNTKLLLQYWYFGASLINSCPWVLLTMLTNISNYMFICQCKKKGDHVAHIKWELLMCGVVGIFPLWFGWHTCNARSVQMLFAVGTPAVNVSQLN